jgi:hypothetical protein
VSADSARLIREMEHLVDRGRDNVDMDPAWLLGVLQGLVAERDEERRQFEMWRATGESLLLAHARLVAARDEARQLLRTIHEHGLEGFAWEDIGWLRPWLDEESS